MTAKRFTLIKGCTMKGIGSIYSDNDVQMTQLQVLDVLNALHEENMCLKGEVAHYKLILMGLEKEAKRITENWKVRK